MPRVYVLDVLEFKPVVDAAKTMPDVQLSGPKLGYYRIDTRGDLILNRRAMKLPPAVWYGAMTGGVSGRIAEWSMDSLRIVSKG